MGRRRLQIIDDKQSFNHESRKFIEEDCHISGKNYHLVAILGPQSSGKSTLLNALFRTNFDVMDDSARAQTTHGVWLSKSHSSNVLVMDVEGTDGRERADDQDFERKGALFSLATAEVLIINIWEHCVGLYHGSNMSLLKTVMDVHLELFKDNKNGAQTTLLFVIRDFVGQTPAESLRATILNDLSSIWSSLKKPENFEGKSLSEFFTLEFAFIPHKILRPNEFQDTCADLSKRFSTSEDSIFGVTVSEKIVPADGLAIYLMSIWEKIISNKDLDLPNQQQLLAQYRCDEIAATIYESLSSNVIFKGNFASSIHVLVDALLEMKISALERFGEAANRYDCAVFEKKLLEFSNKIDQFCLPHIISQIHREQSQILLDFEAGIESQADDFNAESFEAMISSDSALCVRKFKDICAKASQLSAETELNELQHSFDQKLEGIVGAAKKRFIASLKDELFAKISSAIDSEISERNVLLQPGGWIQVRDGLYARSEVLVQEFSAALDSLKYSDIDSNGKFVRGLCDHVAKSIKGALSLKKLRSLAREKFENSFRYDDDGRPRVWTNNANLDRNYDMARESSLSLINELSVLSFDGNDIGQNYLEALEIIIIEEQKRTDLSDQLSLEFQNIYIEAKRSLLSQSSQIPTWIYILIVILGWNEFVSIIKSPLYLLLSIMCLIAYGITNVLGIQDLIIAKGRARFENLVKQFYQMLSQMTGDDKQEHSSKEKTS